jgi:hypothetical protein
MWDMNPSDENSAYDSLGEELCEGDFINDEVPAPQYSDVEVFDNE